MSTNSRRPLTNNIYYDPVFPFSYPNMATANKEAAAIFRNYSETMKPICQHCGSHFDYLATELTDMLKVYEEAEQTM